MGSMAETYDFIVVGAGPAGCNVASRLANSARKPKVLLLEGGGRNDDQSMRIDGHRWLTKMNPRMNWNYKTTPQSGLGGREIDYDRGKGLGGSSAINFAVYDVGPRDDFDEIARLAGDGSWNWKHGKEVLKTTENFHSKVPQQYQKFSSPPHGTHGDQGKLNIGFAQVWDREASETLGLIEQAGFPMNPDMNSGNPLGFAPSPSSCHVGLRSTAADLLVDASDNLVIITDAFVERVIFDGKTAVGVQADGKLYYASKEVILSAGSIDTPKILMLSGVGPEEELRKFEIPIVQTLPKVGKNMRDHIHVSHLWKRNEWTSDRPAYFRNPEAAAAARAQWEKDHTGPLSVFGTMFSIGWLKVNGIYESDEFRALPEDEQQHLKAPTVPTSEFIMNPVDFRDLFNPAGSEASFHILPVLLNGKSRGEITLRSANPADPPVTDPKFLTHPFDQRVAIETSRKCMEIAALQPFAKDILDVVAGPKSSSDEDLLEFWRQNAASTWHATGTVKMGKESDSDACVDKDCRVFGVQGLRVADMSIVPIMPNNHTQTTAYYVGGTVGDKLIAEYGLDIKYQ